MRNIFAVHTICICHFVLVLSSLRLAAQDKSAEKAIDSLNVLLKNEQDDTDKVRNLNQLSYEFSDKDHNKALEYALRARALSLKLDYKKGIAISYRRSGYAYSQMNNYNQAISDLQLALPILKELHDEKRIIATYDDIVTNYVPQGLYAAAISAELEALRLFEKMGDKEASANALQNIGAFYNLGGNDSDALKNLQNALQIRREIKDSSGMAQSLASIGDVYTSSGDFIKALQEDSAAFRLYLELGVRAPDWGISLCRTTLGDNYEKLGEKGMAAGNELNAAENFRKALDNYLPALQFWIKTANTYNIPGTYNKAGFAEMALHRVREARYYFEKGLQEASMISLKEDLKDSYHGLSMVDSLEGNYRQAYEHYQKYIIYRDSLINEKSTKKMTQASMQYEFDKKEALQKAEQEKKDIEAKKEKNIQYFAIGALGLVVLAVAAIAFIQYRSNAHKKKANYLLQQQKEKVEGTLAELKSAQAQLIQSEKMASLGELTAGIAHEIQNPLNFVNNFSEVNKELLTDV